MRADEIRKIIYELDKSPYKCILFDGVWGVGKSYAVEHSLKDICKSDDKYCLISMFGLDNAQSIYYHASLQITNAINSHTGKAIDKALNVAAPFFNIVDKLRSAVAQMNLFEICSNYFEYTYYIVIDDIERTAPEIKFEELFGVIEELKKCNLVKVILIANRNEIKNGRNTIFDMYNEKVIDRIYKVTDINHEIDWSCLKINEDFIKAFLNNHNVKNLRTLQKAQQFYEDVRQKLKSDYRVDFYEEIRLVSFAVVVESIDNIYRYEADDKNNESSTDIFYNLKLSHRSKLEQRIKQNYLKTSTIGYSLVGILLRYYSDNQIFTDDEIDAEYTLFVKTGSKSNFYKSDEEISQVILELASLIVTEKNITKLLRYADEYIIWSEIVGTQDELILEKYEKHLNDVLYNDILNGESDYLTDGIESHHLQSNTNKKIANNTSDSIREKVIKDYMTYLAENTYGAESYKYATYLYDCVRNQPNEKCITIIKENISLLYCDKMFPVFASDDKEFLISKRIMHTIYMCEKEKFIEFCEKNKNKYDKMANHRIEVALKEISK